MAHDTALPTIWKPYARRPAPAGDLQALAGHGEAGARVGELLVEGERPSGCPIDVDEAVRDGQLMGPAQQDDRLAGPIEPKQCRAHAAAAPTAIVARRSRRSATGSSAFEPVQRLRLVLPRRSCADDSSSMRATPACVSSRSRELLPGGATSDLERRSLVVAEEPDRVGVGRRREGDRLAIAEFALGPRGPRAHGARRPRRRGPAWPTPAPAHGGRPGRPGRADRERLLEEGDRLVVRAERGRPLGGAAERDPRLRRQGVGLGARRRRSRWAAR